MKKYKYQFLQVAELDFAKEMSKLGREGWRVIHIETQPPIILVALERELPAEEDTP